MRQNNSHQQKRIYEDLTAWRRKVLPMQSTLRRNALLMSGLALFFWWGFQFAKHDPVLRSIIPFGDDPYDAVSSFGAIAVLLLALLSLVRTFFPQWVGRSGQPIYVLRAQAAIPFCILVTIAAEAVAMARHPSTWVKTAGTIRLLALQTTLTGVSLAALNAMRRSELRRRHLSMRVASVWVGTLLALAVFPEQWILGTPGHLLTVVLEAVFLFWPVSALVRAWSPEPPQVAASRWTRGRLAPRSRAFAVAAAIGLLIGVTAYAGELREEAIRPAAKQILFVGSVYVGLGASGLIIAFVCLGRLLGFVIDEPAVGRSLAN